MRLAGVYSFKNGEKEVTKRYPHLLVEVNEIIKEVDASCCKIKKSKEKTMRGQLLYSPKALNRAFKTAFASRTDWQTIRVSCEYSTEHYVPGYEPKALNRGAYREMDFVKEKLDIEVQFGKYAFMVYNVCAKMTIFHNLGYIDHGIEIVPVKRVADEMSCGVSYYEQFVWDLKNRGTADIDIPVMVLGIDL